MEILMTESTVRDATAASLVIATNLLATECYILSGAIMVVVGRGKGATMAKNVVPAS